MTVTRLPLTGPGVRLPTISSELIARHVQIAESLRSAAIRDAAERISVYPCRLIDRMKRRIASEPNSESPKQAT